MTDDDAVGIVWWNAIRAWERDYWMTRAGSTGRAKDAWKAFKGRVGDVAAGQIAVARCIACLKDRRRTIPRRRRPFQSRPQPIGIKSTKGAIDMSLAWKGLDNRAD